MTPLLWVLTGAGALLVLAGLVGCAIDREIRRDIAAAALGVAVLPVMVPAVLFIRLVRRGDVDGRRLSNRALARFADQRQREDVERHAWMFSLAGRGLIVVRKAPRPASTDGDQ